MPRRRRRFSGTRPARQYDWGRTVVRTQIATAGLPGFANLATFSPVTEYGETIRRIRGSIQIRFGGGTTALNAAVLGAYVEREGVVAAQSADPISAADREDDYWMMWQPLTLAGDLSNIIRVADFDVKSMRKVQGGEELYFQLGWEVGAGPTTDLDVVFMVSVLGSPIRA